MWLKILIVMMPLTETFEIYQVLSLVNVFYEWHLILISDVRYVKAKTLHKFFTIRKVFFQSHLWWRECRSPEEKGLMCVSQIPIARWPWSQSRIVGKNKLWKEQDVAPEGGHMAVGYLWDKCPYSKSWR